MATGLSWLRVTLDTTQPTLTIYLPSYTTNQSIDDITIVANEPLATKQEIYIVDSLGVRHNQTFSLQTDKKTFLGRISFNNFPKGIATIFVTLYDEVWNRSSIYKKSINVIDPQNIKMIISEYVCKLEMEIVTRETLNTEQESNLLLEENIMPMTISDKLEEGGNK